MKLLTLEEVVAKARKVHGDLYEYSKLEYRNTSSMGVITCKIHGDFVQNINSHLNGHGCEKCGKLKTRQLPTEIVIAKAHKKHGGRYDYSLFVHTGYASKGIFGCSIHGFFEQNIGDHLSGYGCPKCGNHRLSVFKKSLVEDVITKAKEVHGDLYGYTNLVYNGSGNKGIITCKFHGDFLQIVGDHLNGHGCPKCSGRVSKPEAELRSYLEGLGVSVVSSTRSVISPLELDIYIPSKNIAIEYCGLYWHSEQHKDKMYHYNKWKLCKEKGIQLITIFEDEWLHKKDVVKKTLKAKLNLLEEVIYARKCEFIYTDFQTSSLLLDENHVQGPCTATYYTGLVLGGRLAATALFIKRGKGFELSRYCSSTKVVGGLSKLIANFRKSHKGEITTFSDHRFSNGQLYLKAGFTESSKISPDYKYVVGLRALHKFGFRRKHLARKLEYFDPNLTEHQNCLNNSIYRIYDCGKTKYLLY